MPYSMEPLSDDCYENTTVLINKFNIRDEKKLAAIEQSITSAMIAKASISIPFENVDFNFYKRLHKYVFSDIYEWAGTVRKINMSKKGTNFCPYDKIDELGNAIFNRLKKSNYLRRYDGDQFIGELTELYCSLNILHPFREGNGRTQRLFISMLIKNLGKHLDFSEIDKDLLLIATIRSANGDIFMLKDIFKEHVF